MKRLTRFLRLVLINNLIRLLERLVRKDSNTWVFSMEGGEKFSGNVYYMYRYIRLNFPEVKTYCLSNHEVLDQKIRDLGGEVYRPNTFKALKVVLKGGVSIFSHEMVADMLNFSRKNVLKINLWHGVPLKKIQYGSDKIKSRLEKPTLKDIVYNFLVGYVTHEEYDLIPCTSEYFQPIMQDAFNNRNVFLTGQPRDDVFFDKICRSKTLKTMGLDRLEDKKILLYLPTFRDHSKRVDDYILFKDNLKAKDYFKENDFVILQKNHRTSVLNDESYEDLIINLKDDYETQELLLIADGLITDYSSCYIDYLFTQRPILFYPYDLEEYLEKDREMYFDYFDMKVTPGKKSRDEEGLLEEIKKAFSKDPDSSLLINSNNFFHDFNDNENSKRVYNKISELI